MSSPTGPAAKTERLLNLVLCLLYTRRPLPKSKIRDIVPQYGDAASDEAFDRMFARDKDELRELGIPLVTEDLGSVWDDEPGYRIDRREYALPEIDFEADELAVLGLASRTWAHASLAGPAAQALRKLKAAADIERDHESLIGIEPRLGTSEPAFDAVKNAVLMQREITFPYRTGGEGETRERRVQPWGMASWHGRWYLTGYDLDRAAPRVFRLSRIAGAVRTTGKGGYEVPAGHKARDMIRTQVGEQAPVAATVRARPGRGQALRRRATASREESDWTVLDLKFTDPDVFAEEVAGYGADVLVESPADVRDIVVQKLRAAAVTHSGRETA